MADTFTPQLNLCKPEIDQSPETWGQKLNSDLDLMDQFAASTSSFIANNNATIQYFISQALPRGIIMAWYGGAGTIPAGWLLCNGANGTPNLTDRFILGNTGNRANWEAGGAFSSGGGTDAQGNHAHGGAVTATAINEAQMPSHQHGGYTDGQGGHNHSYTSGAWGSGNWVQGASGTQINFPGATTSWNGDHSHNIVTDWRGGNQGHNHGIYADGNHAHNFNVSVVPPYMSLCYIMRA